MDISASAYAFIRLGILFSAFILAIKMKVDLWLTILGGCALIFLMSPINAPDFLSVLLHVPQELSFISLMVMLFLILILSRVQAETGQNRRLVLALEEILHSARLRLILFPALVGLLPMPGGALFSCPMLEDAARRLSINEKNKVLINYWFRHIWELAWPLYPGYILISSLLHLPMTTLIIYNFPLVIISFSVGWFIILRKAMAESEYTSAGNNSTETIQTPTTEQHSQAKKIIFYESLPLITTFLGALVVNLIFWALGINISSQWGFAVSTSIAIAVSFMQGRKETTKTFWQMTLSPHVLKILLLVYAIYCFKDTIAISGIVEGLSSGNTSRAGIYAMFIIMPFIAGLLTGIMVGYVGAVFPILIGLAEHMGMHDELLPLVLFGLVAGNAGQLLTPIHVCLVVSCDYFKLHIATALKSLLKPVATLVIASWIWVTILWATGAHF